MGKADRPLTHFVRRAQDLVLISALGLSLGLATGVLVRAERIGPTSPTRGDAPTPEADSGAQGAKADRKIDFNRDVEPIFEARCIKCHGAEKPQAGLRLDSKAAVLRGSISGQVVVAGRGAESLLVRRLSGFNGVPPMPLGSEPLPQKQIDIVRAWIDQMAPQPGDEGSARVGVNEAITGETPVPPQAAGAQSSEARPSIDNRQSKIENPTGKPPAPRIDFTTQIQAIFDDNCTRCHGPNVQQNQLRLDSLAGLMQGSLHGKVIIPGNSKDSPLVRRLLGLDEPRMPFGNPPLAAEKIDLIRAWIDQGAPGAEASAGPSETKTTHWAFIKPARPAMPQVKRKAWVRNPIDNFVLARLEKEGLSPSPEADKETLIRRVSLDLIGLPPRIEEVDAFLADKSPNAYEKVVERLLASPHYGERWARPWLDLARYADTHGYEKDDRRVAWKYRDWVINALNQDMSFREFTIEQIAGDMLANPGTDQLIATGFHRNTLLNQEGGIDQEEQRWYTLVDRVNTTASVWLGITLGCAQCHNHKYDPFTQKDYYQFLAFFDHAEYKTQNLGQGEGWILEPEIELPTPEQERKSKELKAEIDRLQKALDTSTPELEAAQSGWEEAMKRVGADWTVLRPIRYTSAGGATLSLRDDLSILAGGKNPEADTYTVEAQTDRTAITGVRLEVLNDASLPQGGPGRDPEGNFFLSSFEVEAAPADQSQAVQKVVFKEAVANESQAGYSVKNLVNDEPGPKGWAIEASPTPTPLVRQAVLISAKPFGFEAGTRLTIRLKHEMRHAARNIGRFRLSVTSIPQARDPASIARLPARVAPILEIPLAQRTTDQKNQLAAAYRAVSPLLQPTRDRLAEAKKSLRNVGIVTALIMRERDSGVPSTYMHVRGSYLAVGDQVYAAVPAVFGPLPQNETPNRLALAQWLVDNDNPLTARVQVNRFWETLFGRGIVETSEDFGSQGERPTHPELLDWLATEFMRQGWSMKKILRLMVTSATYHQSSRVTPDLLERDPYNKLLARGPRFRVEAEMVRDIALAAGGLLSPKVGGPSVFPYQPEGVWDLVYNDDKWVMSEGEDRYRRGIYTFVRRSAPYPSLVTFDAPSREFCTVRRVRTNTPLQALTTLNNPVFFEAAQGLAKKIMSDASRDPSAGIVYAFRRCLTRRPRPEELSRMLAFYNEQLNRFRSDSKAANDVIKSSNGSTAQVPELAAWTMVSNVLLNLDEMITKE
jgi:mono/diheme cytochrome c family protein